MKKTWIIILVIVAILVIALAMNKKESVVESEIGNMDMTETSAPELTTQQQKQASVAGNTDRAPQAVAFTVNGGNFYFKPNILKVKEGDTVTVTFKNDGGFHDFVIDEFAGAKTKQIRDGAEEKITFIATKKGSFEFYCSVGTHRQMGMKGTLIVE